MAKAIRDRVVELRRVRAADLLPNPKNWRRHPPHQKSALRDMLRSIGYADALIARETPEGLMLIDGHLRTGISGTGEVPVLVVDLDEAEADQLLATLDPLAGMAEPDPEALALLLEGVDIDSRQMMAELERLTGQDGPPVPRMDPDAVPPIPAKPVTKTGDLWLLGEHRLLCGDATDPSQVARLMGADRSTLVFTDPPYGVSYKGGTTKRRELEGDDLRGDDLARLFSAPFEAATQVGTVDVCILLWHASRQADVVYRLAAHYGWEQRAQIIWLKQAQYGSLGAQYKLRHEPLLYLVRPSHPPKWRGPTNENTVWEVDRAPVNEFHPTQKPVALASRGITNHTDLADVVLDLYLGSGSTLIAAESLGRICAAIEIDPAYCDVAVRRWEEFTGGKAKRG